MEEPLSKEKIREAKTAFLLSSKGDGALKTSDLKALVIDMLGYDVPVEVLDNIIKNVDKDGKGKIDYPVYIEIVDQVNRNLSKRKDIRDAFKQFDENGTGFIPTNRLCDILTSIRDYLTEPEVCELIDAADIFGTNPINYEEYMEKLGWN